MESLMDSSTGDDLYARLGLDKTATKAEIKKAYRKAALAHHPDKTSEDEREEAEVRFKAVGEAYDILYDDQKRHLYDTQGMSAFEGPGGMGGGGGAAPDLDDLLASMFGMNMGGMPGGPGGRPKGPTKGENEEQQYAVSLEDLYKGRTVKFSSTKNVICAHCKGKGGKEKATAKECSTCRGAGYKEELVQVGPGLVTRSMSECKVCEGSGKFFQPKDKCKKCKGKRVTEKRKMLEIYIPRGAKSGDKIVLEGEGDQAPDVEAGDIIFHLEQLEHDTFQRGGADLSAHIDISLAEALCGFSRVVLKHLDGRGIEVSHPKTPGDVLQPNQVLKVPGEGMPYKRSEAYGDLYLAVQVKFPENGWASDPATLQKLREMLPGPPPPITAEPIDEVEYDPNGDMDEFGAKDAQGGSAWADEDEDDEANGTQCATQ